MAKRRKSLLTQVERVLDEAEKRMPKEQAQGFARVKERVERYVHELEQAIRPHGLALLPPPVKRDAQGKPLLDAQGRPQLDTERIVLLVHFDDQDDEEHRQGWYEERVKAAQEAAKKVDEQLQPIVAFTRQVWQELMDGR